MTVSRLCGPKIINTKLLLPFSLLHLTQLVHLASSTVAVRPSSGRATLVPGQPLHFQCEMNGNPAANFHWHRKLVSNKEQLEEELLDPNLDNIEIHNERLTIPRPTTNMAGDYICRALKEGTTTEEIPNEFAVIKLRTQPYIEDFDLDTSHTGMSSVVADGDRLELTCAVRDISSPVNITWLRSMTPDDERTMVPLAELPSSSSVTTESPGQDSHLVAPVDFLPAGLQSYPAQDNDIVVEILSNHSKRLVIESIKPEHRSYYVCVVDNGVTERSRKMIFIRVKDKLVALWPLLGIVAELFILFTIIHVWETRRAHKEINSLVPARPTSGRTSAASKRPASSASAPFEIVPLTSGL